MTENKPAALLTVSWDTVIGERQVGGGFDPDDGPDIEPISLGQMVADQITHRIVEDVRKNVTRIVTAQVEQQVQAQVSEWVAESLAKPIQRTNEYGRQLGEPQSVPEMVGAQMKEWLTGNIARDSYRGPAITRLQSMINEEVDKKMKAEMATAIAEAKKKVQSIVAVRAGEVLSEAIRSAQIRDGL